MATTQEKIQQIQQMYGGGATPQVSGGIDIDAALKRAQANKEARLAQQPKETGEKGFFRKAADFFTSSSQAFGDTLGQSIVAPGIAQDIKEGEARQAQMSQQLREKLAAKDPVTRQQGLQNLQNIERSAPVQISEKGGLTEIAPATELSARQVAGQGAGTLAEMLSFGALGGLAKGAKTGQLFTSSQRALQGASKLGLPATGISQGVKAPLTLRIGGAAKEGALLGGLFGGAEAAKQDLGAGGIAKGVLSGSLLGGAIGGAAPALGGAASFAAKKGAGAGEGAAIRVMDSLIKPLIRDLKYLKNPSRGIIREGIVFNTLEEGAQKVGQRAREIGTQIGARIDAPENAIKRIDLSNALKPLDDAIAEASKSPRTNSALITRLKNAKADILAVDDVTGKATRGLTDLSPREAFELKKVIDAITKYTGNASDDTLTNRALQRSRGNIKKALNQSVEGLAELNERYSDLVTAENVIKYRDMIQSRQNIFPLAAKVGNIGGIIAGTVSLNPAIIATAFATTTAEKLLSSPAFKTRLAQWLAKATPKEITEVANKSPQAGAVLDRVIKNLGVRLEPQLIKQELEKIVPSSPR